MKWQDFDFYEDVCCVDVVGMLSLDLSFYSRMYHRTAEQEGTWCVI